MKTAKKLLLFCLFGMIGLGTKAGIYYNDYDFEVNGILYNITSETDLTCSVTYHDYYQYDSRSTKHYNQEKEYSGTIIIPSTVTYKGKKYTVTSIGENAFSWCENLNAITIPNTIKKICDGAFKYCSGLKSVHISDIAAWCNIYFEEYGGVSETQTGGTPLIYATHLFLNNEEITELIIPETITRISSYAFYNCKNLKSVIIPNSVTTIGYGAFYNTNIQSLTIGSGVSQISYFSFSFSKNNGNKPFKVVWLTNTPPENYKEAEGTVNYVANEQYKNLTNKTIYPYLSSIFEVDGAKFVPVSPSERTCDVIDCAYNETANTIHIGKTISYRGIDMNVKQINSYSFYNNPFIKDVKLGNEGIIGAYSFYECANIQTVSLSNQGGIGNYAFSKCSGIKTLDITNQGIVAIWAFSDCTGLQTANICNVGNIGENAFNGCTSFKNLTVANQGNINKYAFRGSGISGRLDVRNTGEIKSGAFAEITGSFDATVNKNVGDLAFAVSTGLKSIKIGNEVTFIEKKAFSWCSQLESIDFGENISSIGDSVLLDCSQLQSISIPDAVTSLGSFVFSGCSNVKTVKIGYNVPAINEAAFNGCVSLADIHIGENVKSIGEYAFNACRSLSIIKIPQSVTRINDHSFLRCTSLKQVIIEDKKGDDKEDNLSIGYNRLASQLNNVKLPLFGESPLDSVYIGRNISYNSSSSCGYSPFYRNTSLRSVVITDRETEISPNEFYGCTNLKNVRIGDGVTNIGDWAFSGCSSLKSFAFGFSVESIGKEAFSDCTAITSIRSRATVPPVCGSQALDDLNKWECTLYVPVGYVNAYMAANQWKEFFFVQEGDLVTFPVTSISLNKESVTLKVNETETLVATLLPENATDKSVKWTSSNETVATVDANGVVTGKKTGKTVITAVSVSNPDVTAACEVIVSQPVQSVTLNETGIFFDEIGATYQLTVIVLPEDAENKSVTWASSNSAVCTVSEGGLVTAIGDGTATVTVTSVDGGKTATCKVTVTIPIPVQLITLNAKTFQMSVGESKQLTATLLPFNATDRSVRWTSSNETVATVDTNGIVTAQKVGKAMITATSVSNPDVTSTCEVTVSQPVQSVTLNETSIFFDEIGATYQLTATVLPEDAENKSVTWVSSNSAVCTVSEEGLVTAIGDGTATVIVTTVVGGKTAKCDVTVSPSVQPVESVSLNEASIVLNKIGEIHQLTATVLPEDANVIWTSSNNGVCTVSQNGLVRAVGPGTATITVASVDGGKTATCEVIVIIKSDVQFKGKYVKQTSFDGAGVYLLACGHKSFSQLDASKTYGYMPTTTLYFQGDDILASTETDAARLTFAETENGYSIVDASGRYIAMKSDYNGFNVYTTAQESFEWNIYFNADGTVRITSFEKEKTIMLGISYGTWGSYPEANDDRAYPNLYKYVAGDEDHEDDDTIDGTKEAPLTVAQLKAHEMNSAKVWVKGYIVGSVNGSFAKTDFGVSEAVASNIILADDASCTDIDACIPIQLPTGAVRSALNLQDNPGNLGKAVTLYGTAEKYFSVAGVKNVSNYVLEGGDDPDPELEKITIGEFLSKADTQTAYILTGKVADIKNTRYGNFNLVEGTDTIYIYGLLTPEGKASQFESLGIEEGDILTLSGKYTFYNNAPQIKNAKYIKHEKSLIPVKTISLNTGTLQMAVGESNQLEATVSPENATDKNLEWSTSDSSVAKVDSSGLVEAVAEGTALITVKSVAYPDVMAMCDVTVIEDNGIMMLQVGEMLYVRAIYDVTGRKLERLQQGINILLLNDGTIKKINLKN